MDKKLIIITGAVGSGKSTVSEILFKKLQNCFWLEGNKCGIIEPIIENKEVFNVVIENIIYVVNNFISNTGSRYIILNWTIYNNEILRKVLYGINNISKIKVYLIILKCDKDELDKRICIDLMCGKKTDRECEPEEYIKMYDKLKGIVIDTTNKTPSVVGNEIIDIIK